MKCFRVLSRRTRPTHEIIHSSTTIPSTIPSIITTNSGSPSHSPTSQPPTKKPGKRPPSLKFNSQQPPSQPSVRYRATTTAVEGRGLREKMEVSNGGGRRPSNPLLAPVVNGNHSKKRGSLNIEVPRLSVNPEYTRGISVGNDDGNGRGLYTPKLFKNGKLTLTYNRAHMKKPSAMEDTPTPGGDTAAFKPTASSEDSYIPKIAARTKNWPSFLARNYYRLNNAKLCLTFLINVILLTYQVIPGDLGIDVPDNFTINLLESTWTPCVLTSASVLHFLLSAVLIVSYCHLQIPLVIFKREKSIARKLEKNLIWVTSKSTESWQDWWDQLVIPASTFPRNYWDKRVKERVYKNFGGDDKPRLAKMLGMEVKSKFETRTIMEQAMEILHSLVDIRYFVWIIGVTLSNPASLYHMLYCGLSFIGMQWNSFFFSIHLLDFVMNFKLLRTVLKSVLHNGKQLAMTVLMTCVVIYIYTVIAFNFFRKFYHVQTTEGEQVFKCDSMLQCFVFHIDQGLRSGGGIADVLEQPVSGDPNESFRLFFDITFFFIVVIILLAIIQGLIIDAFGELRDKEEMLTNEMQTKCFMCGLPKSEFDHIPHGFDNHIAREHNMAHYMFFLMYLIKKKESEFSGQESYVWSKYLHQSMDFFPVGDCFHSQEERTLAASRAAAESRGLQASPGLHKKQALKHNPIKKSQTMFL